MAAIVPPLSPILSTLSLKLVSKVRLIVPRAYIAAFVAYCVRHYLCTIHYAQLSKFCFIFPQLHRC
jgi:hypothetical protein